MCRKQGGAGEWPSLGRFIFPQGFTSTYVYATYSTTPSARGKQVTKELVRNNI